MLQRLRRLFRRDDQKPTDSLPPSFVDVDPVALDELARAGIGEGDFEDACQIPRGEGQ